MIFFEKSQFYSDLKQKAVSDSDYESSFFLYKTLRMRNFGDMNDLYNAQISSYFVISWKIDFNLCMINMAST